MKECFERDEGREEGVFVRTKMKGVAVDWVEGRVGFSKSSAPFAWPLPTTKYTTYASHLFLFVLS